MTRKTMIRFAVATALGSLLLASTALAGPQWTFGPDNKGTLELQYKGQFQALARDIGSGYNNSAQTDNFNFRRNRLALMGTNGDKISFYVQTEYSEDPNVGVLSVASADQGSTFQLLDAVVRFHLTDQFRINVGKFKYNLSRENLEACENPLTLDRSLFIRPPFVTTRDMGVAIWGNVYKDKAQYRVDLMEGRKAVDYTSAPKSDFRFSARGHVSLLDPESEYGYKGTYLGKKKVLTLGASFQFEPNLIFDDTVLRTAPKDYTAWTVDGFLEYPLAYGTPTLSMAYEKIDLDDAYLQEHPDLASLGLNGQKNGYYVKGGFLLPKLPLQVFGRYEQWWFAELNNVYEQRVDWFGAGANYYLDGQNLKLTFEASNTSFDKPGTFTGLEGTNLVSRGFSTFVAQLQVMF